MLKASQKRTKRAALDALDVQAAGQHQRVVGDDAHGLASMRPKPMTMFLA